MPQFESPSRPQDGVPCFRLTEQRVRPGCVEIEVEGELDFSVSDRLRSALAEAEIESRDVLLDFGACDFIDSSVLAILVAARRAFVERNRQLLLHDAHGQVRRLLATTGLAEGARSTRPATVELDVAP